MATDVAPAYDGVDCRMTAAILLCVLMVLSAVPNLSLVTGSPEPSAAGAGTSIADEAPEFSKYIQVNNFRFDPLADSPAIPEALSYGQRDTSQKAFYIVQFKGPITTGMKSDLSSTGVELLHYVNYNAFIVSADGTSIERAKSLSSVRWAGTFEPAYKLSPRLSEQYGEILANAMGQGTVGTESPASSIVDSLSDSSKTAAQTSRYSLSSDVKHADDYSSSSQSSQAEPVAQTIEVLITTFEKSWVDEVSDSVYGLGGNGIMVSYKMWGTVRAVVDRGALAEIARLPGVMWIDRQTDPQIFNDIARWVIQSADTSGFATPVHEHGLWGTGQVVTLADTGIDYDHAAFYDPSHLTPGANHRKVTDYYIPPGAGGDAMDNGINHGSHTAGTIGGDAGVWHIYDGNYAGSNGTAGPHDGQAFDATLQMQDVSVDGQSVGAPADMHDLFQPAADRDSWIHSNSWGSWGNEYITEAAQTDDFLWDNQEFIVFFAAGNSGPYSASISPYAAAKNVIAVGATENGAGLQDIADFSSRGPCEDGRLKPDVMAPGDYVWSVRGLDPSTTSNDYWQLSGTSMATPTVAGAATLVRQYYMDGFYPMGVKEPTSGFTPSAALVKATLINGASEMTGSGAYDNGETRYPNNNQGWGRVLLDDGLFFQGDDRGLMVYDDRSGIPTGTYIIYDLAIGDVSMPVEVTLVWTDYPGVPLTSPALVNDLDLMVTDPSGDVFRGNAFEGYNPGESIMNPNSSYADHINNVESVLVITDPEPGLWSVQVTAYNIPSGYQPYALVMTGGIATDKGAVALDKKVYQSSATANVRVVDTGLNLDSGLIETAAVNMTSSTETIPEAVTLTETGPATAVFAGSIQLENNGVPVAGDGLLQVLNRDNITAEYFDSNDGIGGSGPTYDQASIDDDPPVISNVEVRNVRFNRASIAWSTDESADSLVMYGTSAPPSSSGSSPFLAGAHEINLRFLTENTTYFFSVSSTDEAGNSAVDDNGTAYYRFATVSRPSSPGSDPEWPTYHNNVARVGSSPSLFTPPLKEQWRSSQTYDSMWSGPVFAGGMLFTTTTDGYIRARDAYSGSLIWEKMLGGTNFYTAPAAVSNGVVYVVFDKTPGPLGSTLYALDQYTGEDIWSILPSARPDLNARIALAVADGLVFGAAWSGEVFAVDAANGSLEWTFQTNDLVLQSIAVSSGQVVAGTAINRSVVCLDELTGDLLWSTMLDSYIYSSPMIASGLVYVGTVAGTMYALDEVDGTVVWSTSGRGPFYFVTPASDGASIYFGTDDGLISALDALDGSVLWSKVTGGGWIESSVAYANGYVYVSATDGLLRVYDSSDGSIAGSYSMGPYSTSSPAVSDGWVWVEDGYGAVYAFFGQLPVAVRVSPAWQSMEVAPDVVADYVVEVTNMGSSGPDLFDINVTLGSYGWPADLYWSDGVTPIGDSDSDGVPDTGLLPVNSTVQVLIRVTVPSSAGPDQSEASTANFTSNNDPTVSRTATVVSIVPPPGLAIGPRSYFPLNPGETALAALVVENTGAFSDTADISAVSEHDWAISLFEEDGITPLVDSDGDLIPDTGTIPPSGVVIITVQIQVPTSATLGTTDRTVVTASSSIDPSKKGSCVVVVELAAPPSNDWPTFHNNNAREGMSPSNFLPPLEQEWIAGPYYHSVWSGPVVSDGIVFATSLDGYIRAFDAYTGVVVWSRLLGGYDYYTDTPTVSDGVVYLPFYGNEGGSLYALDALTGNTIWHVGPGSGLDFNARAPVAVSSGMVIGSCWNGIVYAFDAYDGSLVWNFSTGSQLYGGVAVSNGNVYVGTRAGAVYALDELTGQQVWLQFVDGDVTAAPMSARGSVFVPTYYGYVFALDALTGNIEWRTNASGNFLYVTPAYDGTSIYIGSAWGDVMAFDVADGSVLWHNYLNSSIVSSLGYANGYIYFAIGDGSLVTIDASDGSVADIDPLMSWESTSSVAISDSWVWIQDADGYLYGFQGLLPVGMRVLPTYQEESAVPGSTVDYIVTVTNIGTSGNDTFDANATLGSGGWAVELYGADGYTPLADSDSDGLPDTGPLSYEQSVSIVARVSVPASAWPGDTESSGVTFTSSNDPSVFRDALFTTTIPPPGVLLGPNGYEPSMPGKSVLFSLIAFNTGAMTDVFDLTETSSLGWPAALYEYDGTTLLHDTDGDGVVDTGPVEGLGIYEMVVNVTVPADALQGQLCTVVVTAGSSLDPGKNGSARLRVELGASESTEWPTFQHDNGRTGLAPENYSLPLRKVWTYAGTGGNTYGTSPTVSGGTVYYTSTAGNLMAVSATSGEEIWTAALGGNYQVLGTPSVFAGRVFVPYTSYSYPSNHLGALDAYTGDLLWSADLFSSPSFGTPAVAGGVVYIGDQYGLVYAFDMETGDPIWTFSTTGQIRLGPSLIDGRIVVGLGSEMVFALDPDGHVAWTRSVTGEIYGAPSGANGMVYVGTWDGYVYGLDSETGAIVWTRVLGDPVYYSSIAISGDVVYVSDVYGEVHCMNALTGSDVWVVNLHSFVATSIIINNGTLFLASGNGSIAMLDRYSGVLKGWVPVTSGTLESTPSIANGYMYVADGSGILRAFAFADAAVAASVSVDPPSASVVVGGFAEFSVLGTDIYGNPVPYQEYTWDLANGSGTLVPTSETGNECLFIAGTVAGPAVARVHAGALSVDVMIEVLGGSAARIEVSPSALSAEVGSDVQFTATVYDGFGNELPEPVAWTTTIGTMDPDGLLHTGNVAGTGSVLASAGIASRSAQVTVLPGPPDHLSVSPASVSVVAGGVAAIEAGCYDEFDNEIVGLTYDWTTTVGSVTTSGGTYTALLFAGTSAGAGIVTVTCEGLSLTVPVDVTPGPLAGMTMSPSEASVTVAGSIQFTVACYDSYGNELSGIGLTFAVEGGIGSVSPSGLFTAGTVAGSGTVVASAGGASVESAVVVGAGPLHHISVTPASMSISAGAVVAVTAVCYDEFDNELSGMTLSWAASIGTVAPMGAGGQAIFQAGTVIGTGAVTVSQGSVSRAVNVTVVHGALASLVVEPVALLLDSGASGSLTVTAYDVYGNEISGLTFAWSYSAPAADGASGTVTPASDTSMATFTAEKAGKGSIIVESGDVSAEVQVTVEANASTMSTLGPPIAIAVLVLAVIALVALYFFVWRKKMVPPAEKSQ